MSTGLDRARWSVLLDRLELPPLTETFELLDAAHAEPQRAYHTATHIKACLHHLDARRDLAERPDHIELALWFHDAIYKPMSKTNEADSADLAREHLGHHLSAEDMEWIDQAIRLTQTHGKSDDPDTQLLLDIDLSILAASPETYDQYTRDIRFEYRWVPGPLYRKGRRDVLRHFLDMRRIYKRDLLAEEWEAPARLNLSREMEQLTA